VGRLEGATGKKIYHICDDSGMLTSRLRALSARSARGVSRVSARTGSLNLDSMKSHRRKGPGRVVSAAESWGVNTKKSETGAAAREARCLR